MSVCFAENCWHVAASSAEITAETPFAMLVCGQPIVLYRTLAGEVVAVEDRCAHRRAPLSLGQIEPRGIRCLYHGLLFATDGRCVEIPGQERIPDMAKIRAYPVSEQLGWVWVWPGDPALADRSLLPCAVAGDHPVYITAQSHMDYAANYSLIIDNLLDFSHLAFVHRNSFKADPKWAVLKPKITRLAQGVRIERWIPDAPAIAGGRHLAGKVSDTWQAYDFVAPGILMMETCYCMPGTAERSQFGRPAPENVEVRNCATQAVTAMTDRTTRYFFAVALPATDADDAMCARILEVSRAAFLEDKVMIEAQQKTIDLAPDAKIVPTAADAPIAIFHGILRRLALRRSETNNELPAACADVA